MNLVLPLFRFKRPKLDLRGAGMPPYPSRAVSKLLQAVSKGFPKQAIQFLAPRI